MTNGRVRVPGQVTSTQNLGPARPQQKMPGKNNRNKISVLFLLLLLLLRFVSHQLPEDLRELGEESRVQEKASKDKALADETKGNSLRHLSEADIHSWAFSLVSSLPGS